MSSPPVREFASVIESWNGPHHYFLIGTDLSPSDVLHQQVRILGIDYICSTAVQFNPRHLRIEVVGIC